MVLSENAYTIFKEQTTRLLSSLPEDANFTISTAEQEEKLQNCSQMLLEKFFFVIDNYTFSAESVTGVYPVLGYTDKSFSLKKFFSLIHPTHNKVQLINRFVLLETLIKGEKELAFLAPAFIANIALKHASGEYLLFRWQASPFQVSTAHCLISYLNEFTLISSFNNESCHLRVLDKKGKPVSWYANLATVIQNRLQQQTGFSDKEMQVISRYIAEPSSTNATVAGFFFLQPSSIITFNKRILRKAESAFSRRFGAAREVASFLQREGLVSVT